MKRSYSKIWLLAFCLVLSATAWAQSKKITGKVLSKDDKQPIPGANVVVKGTTTGTQTDANGDFAIEASESDVLIVSFIGYTSQEIVSGNRTVVEVTLVEELTKLNEVVVVGYGEQSRKTITSSVAKIDNQVLASAPRANVATALQGTLPGLRVIAQSGAPGSSPQILLRGGASINSPGAPLVIVDGVIRQLNDISPGDIESVELLKDAASTAIYGARANNGVILITTKKGKEGVAQVTYKYTHGFNQRRQGYKFLNAKDYIYYNRLGGVNSGRTLIQTNGQRGFGLKPDAANLASFDIRLYNPADVAQQDLLNKEGWQIIEDPYPNGGKIIFKDHSGEIENLLFRNTSTDDHYINVAGGNAKGKYFASFDYYKESGVVVGSDYKRFTGDINGSYKVKDNVEIGTAVVLSTSSQLGVAGTDINTFYRTLALWPTFNPWLDKAKTLPNPGSGITDGNPLYYINNNKRTNESNRVSVNAWAKWDVLPGLSVKATANAYLFETFNTSFTNALQLYTTIPAGTYSSTTRESRTFFSRDFQKQFNVVANYNKTFNTHHNVSALLGAEYYTTKNNTLQLLGQNAPSDDIITANASTTFPAGINNNYSTISEFRLSSQFGRLNYDFDQKYLVSLVFRRDGASSLASNTRFGIFPGMSVGWNAHSEDFFKNSGVSKIVSNLKPRISYGVNGNIAGIGQYETQGVYGSQGNYNGSLGFLNTGIVNNKLRWEKSKTVDVGLDLGILSNRVTFIVDYFDRRTSDLLTDLTLPEYTGFSSIKTNLGTFQNKGLELAVSADVFELQNGLKLTAGANATLIKNKILKLPYNGNENNRQGGFQVYDPAQKKNVWVGGLQEGQPLGSIYAYKQVSIFASDAEVAAIAGTRKDIVANISGPNSTYGAGKITAGDVNWQDVDGNGQIDSYDQVYIGNINPTWTGGFSTTLSFKGWSLFSRFDYALGHTIYNDQVARILGNYQGTFNFIDLQKRAWNPQNTHTDISKVYGLDQSSAPQSKKNYTRGNNAVQNLNGNNSRFYEKGDYLACREITLSYQFPKELLAKTKVLSSARFFMSANNLFYITKFSGQNPEPTVTDGALTGVYRGAYPTPKSYVFGVAVSF